MDNKRLEWFLLFLPVNWMKTVLLSEVNRNIVGGKVVEWPEFRRFIGLLFLMATVQVGCNRRSWFEDTEPSEFDTICCDLSGTMFNLEIKEGKDKPCPGHILLQSKWRTVRVRVRVTESGIIYRILYTPVSRRYTDVRHVFFMHAPHTISIK